MVGALSECPQVGHECRGPAPSLSVGPLPGLTKREIDVLRAWLRAPSKEEAADALFIAPSTVSTHIARVRAKYAAVGRPAPSKISLMVRALQDEYIGIHEF